MRRYSYNCSIEEFWQVEQSDRPEFLRLPGEGVQKLPEGLSLKEAATLGVAGYSAALAVDRMEELGVTPGSGPVVVTGATGGVGSFAVSMLARRDFRLRDHVEARCCGLATQSWRRRGHCHAAPVFQTAGKGDLGGCRRRDRRRSARMAAAIGPATLRAHIGNRLATDLRPTDLLRAGWRITGRAILSFGGGE